MRILVVEDEPKVASFIRRALEEESYAVDVCTDGTEGLDWAQMVNYDLMILDLMLPGLPGVEVLKRARAAGEAEPERFENHKRYLREADAHTASELVDSVLSLATVRDRERIGLWLAATARRKVLDRLRRDPGRQGSAGPRGQAWRANGDRR